MQPMPPKAASPQAAPLPDPAQKGPSKSPKDLIVGINDDLMQLAELLSATPATKQEAQQLAQLQQAYQGVVESLGQSPGEEEPQMPAPKGGVAPVEAGAADVRPV